MEHFREALKGHLSVAREAAQAHHHLVVPVIAQLNETLVEVLIAAVHNGAKRVFR